MGLELNFCSKKSSLGGKGLITFVAVRHGVNCATCYILSMHSRLCYQNANTENKVLGSNGY